MMGVGVGVSVGVGLVGYLWVYQSVRVPHSSMCVLVLVRVGMGVSRHP